MKTLHLSIIAITTIILTSVILIPTFGEGPQWQTSHAMIKPDPSNPAQPTQTFNIQYRVFNGTIDTFKVQDHYFIINTHSKNNGLFEIKIPRNYPYYNGKEGPSSEETYLVIEGALVPPSDYVKTVSDCFFTYSIPLYENTTITIMSKDSEYLMTPTYGDKVPDYCLSQTIVSADNVTSTAYGGLVRLHNELASGTVSIGPLPMQSDIRQDMFYWCSTIGSDDSTVDPKILQFVQENSPDLLNKIPDVEQTNQKIRGLYWEALQRKLISDTQEFLYLHGMTSSIIFQYAISATSCPPNTDVNGTFATTDGNGGIGKYKFDLGYNAETYQYTFTQLEPIKFASPLKQSQTGISAKDVKCEESLVLVIKNDGMPICVKPATVDKLFKRGILQTETMVQT